MNLKIYYWTQNPKISSVGVLHTTLHFKPYKLELLQALSQYNKVSKEFYCDDLITRIKEERINDSYVLCSNEAVFHSSETVSKDNVHIQGSEDPNSTLECVQASPKVNMFCALLEMVYVPIFFTESANANIMYLSML